MPFLRYSRWDGSQEGTQFTAEDVMQRIALEMPDTGDLGSILRRLFQKGAEFPGGRRMMGLQELMDRLRQSKEQNLERYNLGSALDDIKERLDRIIKTEQGTVQRGLEEPGEQGPAGEQPSGAREEGEAGPAAQGASGSSDQAPGTASRGSRGADPSLAGMRQRLARKRQEQLDRLPPDVGGRIRDLREYDFLDPEARQQFEELLQMLQQQIMQSYFQGLQQGLQSMTPEAMRQVQEMVRDLNRMLEQRGRGEEPDFQGFMQKWGQFFPPGIENLDQLLDHLQRQMAQMQSLLDSMTPEMRQQLEQMVDSLLQDTRLQWELVQLASNLQRLRPTRGMEHDFNFSGDEPLSLQEAMRLMGDMNSLDELERQVMQAVRSNDASDVNADEVQRLLGEEAGRMLEQMQQLTKMLEEAGFIKRKGDRWELTPEAVRRVGQRALEDIFSRLRMGTFGSHGADRAGIGVEGRDETKAYAYGDPFLLDTQKTVANAIFRQGPGTPVQLQPQDFEVVRTTALTRCATVIMLDMSYSMMMGGCFQAGRKVALALNSLIRSQFPKDNLDVVAFSYFVLALKPEMLLDSYWVEYGGGTNFQEALRQARQILGRQRAETKQVIMITDGEPTTYNYGRGGGDWGDLGRPRNGLEETLREVSRCTKEAITINTFMMDRHRYSLEFVRLMTKINRGRVFFATPDNLGEYILWDYVTNKRKVLR